MELNGREDVDEHRVVHKVQEKQGEMNGNREQAEEQDYL